VILILTGLQFFYRLISDILAFKTAAVGYYDGYAGRHLSRKMPSQMQKKIERQIDVCHVYSVCSV